MRMNHRPIPLLLAILTASVFAACSGGGGGGTGGPPPTGATPTPTPTASPTTNPQCRVLAPQSTGSTYTLQSNPSGLTVQRVDPTVTTTTCVYFTGITQTT